MSAYTVLGVAGLMSVILATFSYFFSIKFLDFWPRVILGTLGMFLMLIMHIYSIRKRKKAWKIFQKYKVKLSKVLNWHIMLATTGVTFIFFHAVGSYDSVIAWVAFISMFIVWQSGFVGRYIFVKIPKDPGGFIEKKNRVTEHLEELNHDFIAHLAENKNSKDVSKILYDYLGNYGNSLRALHHRNDGSLFRFFQNLKQILTAWKFYRNNMQMIKSGELSQNNSNGKSSDKIHEILSAYQSKMNSILLLHFQLEFFDVLRSLFRNWHDIHVPLTYLFYTTATLHVLVVVIFSSFAK